jgi:hypothetical protein
MKTDRYDFLAAALGLLTGFLLSISVARTHDGYEGVLNNQGVSCCNNYDCKPISEDALIQQRDGSYLVPSLRTVIPKDRVIPTPSHLVSKSLYHICCFRDREAPGPATAYYCTCLMVPMGT